MSTNPTSQENAATIRLDDLLGLVSSDGRNTYPWPSHFSDADWYATKAALDSHASDQRRIKELETALWGLKEAVRTAYLAGHINDLGYPTFRMDDADKLLSQGAPK